MAPSNTKLPAHSWQLVSVPLQQSRTTLREVPWNEHVSQRFCCNKRCTKYWESCSIANDCGNGANNFYELSSDFTLSNVSCNVCRNSIGDPRSRNIAYCKSSFCHFWDSRVTHNSSTFYRFSLIITYRFLAPVFDFQIFVCSLTWITKHWVICLQLTFGCAVTLALHVF